MVYNIFFPFSLLWNHRRLARQRQSPGSSLCRFGQLRFFQHDFDALRWVWSLPCELCQPSSIPLRQPLHSPVGSRRGGVLGADSQFFGALDCPFDESNGSSSNVAADFGGILDRDVGRVADGIQNLCARVFGAAQNPDHDSSRGMAQVSADVGCAPDAPLATSAMASVTDVPTLPVSLIVVESAGW